MNLVVPKPAELWVLPGLREGVLQAPLPTGSARTPAALRGRAGVTPGGTREKAALGGSSVTPGSPLPTPVPRFSWEMLPVRSRSLNQSLRPNLGRAAGARPAARGGGCCPAGGPAGRCHLLW